jgi:hypothetical protein
MVEVVVAVVVHGRGGGGGGACFVRSLVIKKVSQCAVLQAPLIEASYV